MTDTLRQWVERLVDLLPIRHVADLVGLHWHTVKTIDKQRLQRNLPVPDATRLRRLMMDEFALHKGHRYATVVACRYPNRSCGAARAARGSRSVRSSNG